MITERVTYSASCDRCSDTMDRCHPDRLSAEEYALANGWTRQLGRNTLVCKPCQTAGPLETAEIIRQVGRLEPADFAHDGSYLIRRHQR